MDESIAHLKTPFRFYDYVYNNKRTSSGKYIYIHHVELSSAARLALSSNRELEY